LFIIFFVCFLGSFWNFPWSTIKTPTSSPHTSCLVHSNIFALFIMSEWIIVV
jgi:hypothetical protein